MPVYTCERCLKEFSQKSHYNTHLKRITPCQNNKSKIEEVVEKMVNEKINNSLHKKLISKNENVISQTNSTMKFIDLCCGIGGFHQALKNLGFECVMASDIDEECRKNYKMNYNIEPKNDLTKIKVEEIPNFNILCAGFPCQPFSKAGEQKGFQDTRGNIFFDICKIIKYHNPEYLILENVRNLASHDKGNTWKVIYETLDNLNYYTYNKPVILNTLYFGVPQSRERVVILCKRKDLGELPNLPSITKECIKKTNLSSIIEDNVSEKYNLSEKLKITEIIWNEFIEICNFNNIEIPKYPIWTDWWDSDGNNTNITKFDVKLTEKENKINILKKQKLFYDKYKKWIDSNREFYNKNRYVLEEWLTKSRRQKLWVGAVRKLEWQTKGKILNMKQVLWSPRGSGIRIKNIDYSPTLVAMASMIPIYGPKSRQLTPRECARLQSFPENYIIHNNDKIAYKQFGNAVNVKMIEQCAQFLINNQSMF